MTMTYWDWSPQLSAPAAFARLAGTWFLGLFGIYAVYMGTVFLGLREETTILGRLVMVAGPMTLAVSLLVAPSVFAAARDHFDLTGTGAPETRARQWALLIILALAAYLLSAFGPSFAESLLATPPGESPPEPLPEASGALRELTRFLLPFAIGLFTIVSGCAGALVGHVTRGWRPRKRDVAQWAVGLALVASFLFPLLVAASFALNGGTSVAWIILAPLFLPTLFTTLLVWRERGALGLGFGMRGFASGASSVDAAALERIVSAVARDPELDLDTVAHTSEELEMARLARAVHRIAGPAVTLSEERTDEIVRVLRSAAPEATPTTTERRPPRLALAGTARFWTGWTCLAAGLLIVSPIGGVPPSVVSAVAVGCVGSAGIVWITSRRPRPALTASA